jgi:glyoxylase-like metal-dependent hydrolase (beta-lactamase superfamily II)
MGTETFRFQVGGFSCMTIRDNVFRYPSAMFFTNVPPQTYQPLLGERGEDPEQLDLPYTCLLIDTGRERLLIDTGIGRQSLGPVPGQLLPLLRSEGVEPGDIGIVLLSHAHPDHSGGTLAEDGKPAFPNARYVMSREEWDFWTSQPGLAELPLDDGFRQWMQASARTTVAPLRGRIELVQGRTEILPGITAFPAFGHTPGHMAVEISSGDERLLFVGDAIIHPIDLQYPQARAVVDHQPESMLATRLQLLETAANARPLVSTSHFPFPGLGYVAPNGARWQWEPIQAP